MGVPGTGFRSLNGSAIATRSRSNGFGSVSTSGISVRGYGTQYRSETSKGCSIAKTETASSQHRLWITPIIIRASRYGVGSSALVMAPLTSKGNWKGCYWCYRYCSRYHRQICFSISGGLSLLLLVSASGYASAFTDAYGLLAGSNPKTSRFDRPGPGWWIE